MHSCQWLISSQTKVDHLFRFWRRLTQYEHGRHAAKHSHINLWRQIVPLSPQVLLDREFIATDNGAASLPHLHTRKTFPTAQSLIRFQPRHWAQILGPSNLAAGGSNRSTIAATSVTELIQPEVHMMLHGQGYTPKPVPPWRKSPPILASRKAEFRPLPPTVRAEVRALPEKIRALLPGCMSFPPQRIALYFELLLRDGQLVSGVENLTARRARTKPGRLYHKFDSLCALATSKAGRLLLLQHKHLNHIFSPICYDPAHKLYNELLNMYERRWFAVSKSYGKS